LGSGPKEASIRRRVDELSLRSSVTFAGDVREWMKVLKGADIFVQTKAAVNLQIHPLEAMAAGMAVIACDDGVEDYFHHDRTVLLANPADVGGFQRCLTRLLNDHGFARTLAQQALDHVRQNHAPSAMASQYARLYRRLHLKERTFRVEAPA
jgi:rhamnosyl/mannosyltransferase